LVVVVVGEIKTFLFICVCVCLEFILSDLRSVHSGAES